MKAAIYVRVSTDQQAEKGYSIDTQLEACRKYALTMGAEYVEEFIDDGYSGEFIDRPALTTLREKLTAKEFQMIIAYAPDRLSRNTIHLLMISQEIAKAGALRKFASVNFDATPEGELMYKFQGIVAEYEKEKIKERTLRGKRGKVTKGLVISDAKPFGYTFDHSKNTYVINETEAAIVSMIFELIVKKKIGTTKIGKELTLRGIPSPRKKNVWLPSSVHRILTNTMYKGIMYSMKYRYEKIGLSKKKRTLRPTTEWITIPIPPIVDEMTWQAAQEQLQRNKNFARRNVKYDYLLNGLIICAKCGKPMVISHSGCKKRISYYVCLSQRSSTLMYSDQTPCTARQIPTMILDEQVFHFLMNICHNRNKTVEYVQAIMQKTKENKPNVVLAQLVKNEAELLQQKSSILQWFRQKILHESEVENQLKNIQQQLASIVQMKQAYETELLSASMPPSSLHEITSVLNIALEKKEIGSAEKRAAIFALVDRIFVERIDHTKGRGSRPEMNIQIQLK